MAYVPVDTVRLQSVPPGDGHIYGEHPAEGENGCDPDSDACDGNNGTSPLRPVPRRDRGIYGIMGCYGDGNCRSDVEPEPAYALLPGPDPVSPGRAEEPVEPENEPTVFPCKRR